MTKEPEIQNGFEDDDEFDGIDERCPNCGDEYDDIDFDYQICHRCGYNNNPLTPKNKEQ